MRIEKGWHTISTLTGAKSRHYYMVEGSHATLCGRIKVPLEQGVVCSHYCRVCSATLKLHRAAGAIEARTW